MPSEPEALAFGDILLVPFPFTDQSSSKRRPAVVISAQADDARRPDVILMPVTSQVRAEPGSGDILVEGWKTAGLLKPSAIKPIIATLERSLIVRRLGRLGSKDIAALKQGLADLIG